MTKEITATFFVYPTSPAQAEEMFLKGYSFSYLGCSKTFRSEEQGILEEVWLQNQNIPFSVGYKQSPTINLEEDVFSPNNAAALVSILRDPCFRSSFYFNGKYVSRENFEAAIKDGHYFNHVHKYEDIERKRNFVDDVHMQH